MILKEQHHDCYCLSICTEPIDQWMNERQCVRTHTHSLKHYMQGHSTDWHQGVQQYSMGCILRCSYVSMNGSVCVSWPSSLVLKARLTLVNVPLNGFRTNVGSGQKERSEALKCVELHCRLEALLTLATTVKTDKKNQKVGSNPWLNGSSAGRDSFTNWSMSFSCSFSIFCHHLVQFRELKFLVRLRELEYSVN